MGSASDNYVLKWNEFHTCVANSFTHLRNAQEFLDVTVAVDEHHQLQAHKVILSASSPYFRSMLINNPSQHPVLVMPPHVRPSDLGAVIDFIYQGEVKIPTSELTEFIALAQMLKIKGLTDDFEKEQKRMPKPPQPKLPPGTQIKKRSAGPPTAGQMPPMPPNAPPKRPRMGQNPMMHPPRPNIPQGFIPPPEVPEENEGVDEDDVHEVEDEDSELYREYDDQYDNSEYPPMEGQPGPPPPPPPPAQPMAASHGGHPPGPSQGRGPVMTGLICPHCGGLYYGPDALKSHMNNECNGVSKPEPPKKKQDEKTDACHICDKKFKGQKNVQAHIRRVHKIPAAEQGGAEMMDPEGGPPPGGKVVKKKGRPKKDSSMQQHQLQPPQQPPQVQPGMSRPIGQVSPAPRPPQEMQDMQSRPPVVQQDRGASPMSTNRPRPHGMMSPSSSSGPPMKRQHHPQHNILGPGMAMRPRAPPQQYPQYPPQGGSMDIKRLGQKLGGAISITSSEHQSPQPLRRPMPSTSRGAHASSPKSDPLATTSRPPLSSQRQDRLSQEVPVEVKQEPMDDMYEEGEEMPEDFENEEEEFGDEEEEEDGEQEYEEGMYEEGEAPYDDEHEEGSFQQ